MLSSKLGTLAITIACSAHLTLFHAAANIGQARAEPRYFFRPYGRPIFAAFIALIVGWLARDYWRLSRDWDDPTIPNWWRHKAIGFTAAAILFSIIAVGSLLYDLARY